MATSLASKLKIQPGTRLYTLHAPDHFTATLGKLPAGARVTDSTTDYEQVHWFVRDQAQLKKEVSKVIRLVKPGVTIWAYYPKKSSSVQTDLTRDKGWEPLLAHDDRLTWINLISFDDSWSVFGFRAKTAADVKKEANKQPREIFNWVDPVTKSVTIPDDLAAAFKKHKREATLFHGLAFSHKKEYIEWIVTAKKEETRLARIEGTIKRLKTQLGD